MPALKRKQPIAETAGSSGGQTNSATSGTPQRRVTIPRPGALKAQPVLMKQTSSAQSTLPDHASIIGSVFRYSDDGSIWAQGYPSGDAIYVVALHHRQRKPSVTWNILQKFQAYLRRQAADENALPVAMRELNDSWHIRLVLKPRTDPDDTFDSSVVASYFVGGQGDINNMFIIFGQLLQ